MNDYKKLIEMLRDMSRAIIRDDAKELGVPEELITDVDADACNDAADAIEQLVKERDAAIKDMQDYQGSFCCYCKRNNTEECLSPEEVPLMCGKFEWRGVQE